MEIHRYYGVNAYMFDTRTFHFDTPKGTGQASMFLDEETAVAHLKALYVAVRGQTGFDLVRWALWEGLTGWMRKKGGQSIG